MLTAGAVIAVVLGGHHAGDDGRRAGDRAGAQLGAGKTAQVDGTDLVLIEGDKLKRNEVYYDRAALASLVVPEQAAA